MHADSRSMCLIICRQSVLAGVNLYSYAGLAADANIIFRDAPRICHGTVSAYNDGLRAHCMSAMVDVATARKSGAQMTLGIKL